MKERSPAPDEVREVQPMVASAALLAAGIIRNISIKHYAPKYRRRELDLLQSHPETYMARCSLFREKGLGEAPTIVVGGFVPDATETVEFQRRILRRYGSIYYMNFPRNGFCKEMFAAQLGDLIDHLAQKRNKPFVFSVSFGCGLLMDYLRNTGEGVSEKIRGLIFVSPVICTEDLIRPTGAKSGGVRLLEHNLKKIMAADQTDAAGLDKLIERSRRCFHALFTGGAGNRKLSVRHLSIRKKIFDVITGTSVIGGLQRVMALRDFEFPAQNNTLYGGPVLTLLAEHEDDMLVASSPTLQAFRNTRLYTALFPECHVRAVNSGNPDDGVPHASLIFHHEAYNRLIQDWYDRRCNPLLQMAV